ncbi:NADH dehydrogenase [ubiquinone] 1 alpha subcomplex subunit 5-like [Mizuhopecten yessoensis]|uniref:NADH dehydrogenase [ubiquinone] 1 alpha subcomplex subunit 5 n=1 Tax=Mizuhopecten yessoensis TaxID=6573 RepID=A0A210PJM5_MIZYE|nr:NADH dehydrogenase [ubiquinone] 1 alpha subcomplex subunit 5-like [Mizuhopecten yessoensis]OWF36687.1 NADH dehydrogenase [ubiquinone] 1 alpha subcomplex subunit 5 [Mizuhopecten yessoensis]
MAAKNVLKTTTGLTRLAVNPFAHENLKTFYDKTLRTLAKMPADAAYRQNTESIIKNRLALVEKEPNIEKLEQQINDGLIEEVVLQAKRELKLSRQILECRAWEPLIAEAPKNQWKWPI